MQLAQCLSQEFIEGLPPALPVFDESRVSPADAGQAAELKKQYTLAAAVAQDAMRSMRKTWLSWAVLPGVSAGQSACISLPAILQFPRITVDCS
jgi:hypothetical protein